MEEEAERAIELEHHEMEAFAGVEARESFHFQHGSGSILSSISATSCTISYSRFARVLLYFLLLITCLPIIAGAAFTSIFIEDGNYNAAVISFFTACVSVGTASMFCLHLGKKIEKIHDNKTLSGLKLLGMIMSVTSGISLGVDVIIAFFNKQTFAFNGMNFFSGAVFSGIWLASSIELYYVAQWYQGALEAQAAAASSTNDRIRSLY